MLNYFAGWSAFQRRAAVQAVETILEDEDVQIAACSLDDFVNGLQLYSKRARQGYS